MPIHINTISAQTAKQWLDDEKAILIDVRDPSEHKAQNIPSAQNHPLQHIDCSALSSTDKKILIHCQKGMRGSKACEKLLAENNAFNIYNIEGGIEGWKQAGLPVNVNQSHALPIERQVHLIIGVGIVVFSLLAYFASSAFAFGTLFLGAGLMNSGLTGWCGLAKLIQKMPWNSQ